MTITIYHNPRCSKSRQALTLLEESGKSFDLIKYLQTPLTDSAIRILQAKIGGNVRDMVRTGESVYKKLELANADDNTLFSAMASHPILIERAIVEKGDTAIVARPPERLLEII